MTATEYVMANRSVAADGDVSGGEEEVSMGGGDGYI